MVGICLPTLLPYHGGYMPPYHPSQYTTLGIPACYTWWSVPALRTHRVQRCAVRGPWALF